MSAGLLKLASQYEAAGNGPMLLKLAKFSESVLLGYLDQVPCIFAYRLANTDENRKRGRVGRLSGFRQGVRNPAFIPDAQHAKTKSVGSTRYYDLGRQAWRAWKRGNVVSVTAFWSVEENKFVDTPELAGIVAGKPFRAAPKAKPAASPARAATAVKRETQKREREKVRNRRALAR